MSEISGLLAPRTEKNTEVFGKTTINRENLVEVLSVMQERAYERVINPFSANPEYMRGAAGAFKSILDLIEECKLAVKR